MPLDIHLVLSNNGQFLITGGRDKKINVWDANTGKRIQSFLDHQNPITALHLSKDMKYLVSQDDSYQISIRSYPSGKVISVFPSSTNISQHNFSKNGGYLNHQPALDTLQKINLINGEIESTIKLDRWLYRMIITRDETKILGLGSQDTSFYLDAKTGKIIEKNVYLSGAKSFKTDLKGRIVFMNKTEKKIFIFDSQLKTYTTTFGVFTSDIQEINFSKDGQHILINDSELNLEHLDLRNSRKLILSTYPLVKSRNKHHAELSPDAKKLAIATSDGSIQVWDTENKSLQQGSTDYVSTDAFQGGWTRISPAISDLNFSADGKQIILADYTYGLYFFDVNKLSNQFFYNNHRQNDFNLIQPLKDSSLFLVNYIDESYGGFYQFDTQELSKDNIRTSGG
ncbi:WD40 repeat domain-containing protein [Haliscomenobacter hydrossis]|uniref:WD40 repeat-containing protein n=1 Tax=Haliscomenobacter hydrossis (strain ATCC 27775 / DSM 1100 / LMG 10767 / O) TaxID=760192 RepID=F4KTM2_HALH1|nr:WD40 repeat domain-containing protein [Haliscomenobacter hydrossis]AEE53396.1 WD40 repeat-containing protein [Haliscomenobacter hydrossis DSM 1100]